MPRKKKITFDNRDALEILRDAFFGAEPAKIAELGTRRLKTRTTAAEDPYREPITQELKHEPIRHVLKEKTARKAIDLGLVENIHKRIKQMEGAELPPEDRAQLEEIRKKYEKKTKEEYVGPTNEDMGRWENEGGALSQEKTKPSLEVPKETEQTPPDQLEVEEGARRLVEIFKNRPTAESKITGIEMWAVNMKERAKNEEIKHRIDKTEKRAKEIVNSQAQPSPEAEPPTPPPAIEIAKASKGPAPVQEKKEPEPTPAPTPEAAPEPIPPSEQPFDLGTPTPEEFEKQEQISAEKKVLPTEPPPILTQKEVNAILETLKEEKKIETAPKDSRENRIASFEEKTAALEKAINETGGTPEQKSEHLARQAAKKHNFDLATLTKECDQLKASSERVGNVYKIHALESAIQLVKSELGEYAPSQTTSEIPSAPEAMQESAPADTDKAFEEFGISKDDLEKVEGFGALNENQKAFVFENLRRVLYGNIETQAKAMLAEETSQLSTARRTGRKVFEGYAGQGGKLAVKEAEALKKIRTGGIEAHGETLRLLVQMTNGREIVANPDTGALEISYINSNEFGSEHHEQVQKYNNAARQLANTPETWAYSRASKKERAQYEAAQLQYDNARRSIFQLASAKQGDFASASEFMLNRDSQIYMQRVLAGCPQLETVLSQVDRIEKRSAGKAAAGSAIKESGWKAIIAGTGTFMRWKSMSVLALSATEAAMGVGAVVNSAREAFQARKKAREELATAQQDLTRSEKAALKLKEGRTLFGLGKKEHLRLAGHAFRKTAFIDASNYNERMQKLLEKTQDPANKKNALNQQQLHRLVDMAEEHLAEGLVNFGKDNTRLAAAYEFSTNLAKARVELARSSWTDQKNAIPNLTYFDTEGNLQKTSLPAFMKAKHMRISREEKKFILRGFTRGLAVGAVAGGVGAAFGGWIKDRFGDDIQQWIGSAREKFGNAVTKLPGSETTHDILGDSAAPKPPKNLPVMGGTQEVLRQADTALLHADNAAAQAELTAKVLETELAARRAEQAAEHLAETPIAGEPGQKGIDVNEYKYSHIPDPNKAREIPRISQETVPQKPYTGYVETEAEKKLRLAMEKGDVIFPKVGEAAPKVSPDTGDFASPANTNKIPPIGADRFGKGAESGLLADGSDGATIEEYKALRGMGPTDDEFPTGKAWRGEVDSKEYAKLSEVKKGEGMWHAIRRQLNYQMSHSTPEEFASRYGISPEEVKLHPKKSVERVTANLLTDQDYIKPKGAGGAWTETRISKPGTRVLLGEDGKIEITGKGKLAYEWQKASTNVAPERLLSSSESAVQKMAGLNMEKYANIRDTSLAEFLKKPPRGKGFKILVEILNQAKPAKADMQKSIGEFLTNRFGK